MATCAHLDKGANMICEVRCLQSSAAPKVLPSMHLWSVSLQQTKEIYQAEDFRHSALDSTLVQPAHAPRKLPTDISIISHMLSKGHNQP